MKSIVRAKKKTNRSLHANLWGDPKSPFLKREYGPGQHGARKKKLTDYGEQLQAKQRLKTYYGNVSEKQLRKYYAEAIRRRGDTAEHLIGILESRLDNLVYKAKFVPTIFAARQFVNHAARRSSRTHSGQRQKSKHSFLHGQGRRRYFDQGKIPRNADGRCRAGIQPA